MVLLPGLDGTGKLFAPLLETLPPIFEPCVVAYPNKLARSYDDLLPNVQRVLPRDNPFLLVAESFSGPLAIKIASMQPNNLKALILCATFAENPLPGLGWIHWGIRPWMFRVPVPEILLRYLLTGAKASNSLANQVRQIVRSVRPEAIASRLRLVLTADAAQAVTLCPVPILYLRATRDRLIGRQCAARILQLNPQARKVDIDAPHLLLQSEPEKAVAAITAFCELLA